jgi:hypothetical protein
VSGAVASGAKKTRSASSGSTCHQDFRDIFDRDLLVWLQARHPVAQHVQAERAGGGENPGTGRNCLLHPDAGDALLGGLLEPHSATPSAAAKSLLSVPRHFRQPAVAGADQFALGIDLAIGSCQVTRVVQRNRFATKSARIQPIQLDQLAQELGMVPDTVAPAE